MTRVAEHPIDPVFTRRWSPRAMSGEPLTREQLFALFEAARWSPSAGNAQPWRFVYALRGTEFFHAFLALLAPRNREWCLKAGALVVLLSRNTLRGMPLRSHSFDAGAAWMSLALQGTLSGLVVHAMQGFDQQRARDAIGAADVYDIQCMIAVGHPGRSEDLSEAFRALETPNQRRRVSEFVFEGVLPTKDEAPGRSV